MPLTMLEELPVRPLVLPQLQPCGRGVHVPKSLPEGGDSLETVTSCELVAVWEGEDESWTISVTVSIPAVA